MKPEYESALVTGGAGFIGSHLCEALVKRGVRVSIIDNLSMGRSPNIGAIANEVDFCELDIRSRTFRDYLLDREFDVLFHFAGTASVPRSIEDPGTDFETNLMASFQLLESIRSAGFNSTLIMASSAAVYGNPSSVPVSETDPAVPISPYGVSKLAMERYTAAYCGLYRLKAASLRPFSVYGPRLRKQIVYDFITRLSDDPSELVILGDGSQVRDFVYVDDIVEAALLVAEKGTLRGEVYNVACGQGYSTKEMAEAICNVIGVTPEIRYTGTSRPGEPEKWIANISKLRTLGFAPRVALEEGLTRTYEWYMSTVRVGET